MINWENTVNIRKKETQTHTPTPTHPHTPQCFIRSVMYFKYFDFVHQTLLQYLNDTMFYVWYSDSQSCEKVVETFVQYITNSPLLTIEDKHGIWYCSIRTILCHYTSQQFKFGRPGKVSNNKIWDNIAC